MRRERELGTAPSAHAVEIAQRLLDAGADPNGAFTIGEGEWCLRFCALTGVMGRGEMDAPAHPDAFAIARLLLERGADPNPSQGLYNTCLHEDDVGWLELLARHGLTASAPTKWHADPAHAAKSGMDRPGALFGYLLVAAAKNGQRARLRWLIDHGADVNARSTYTGLSAYQTALLAGEAELADRLEQAGAVAQPVEGAFAFAAACMRGDEREARRLLALDPSLVETSDTLAEAVGRRNTNAVRILLALGVDPNRPNRHGGLALHSGSQHRVIAELLLAHGADPRARCHGGTPARWALDRNPEMAGFLAEHSRSILDAVVAGHVDLARELLAEQPARISDREPSGDGVLHVLPSDPDRAQELIALLLAHGADPEARNDAGQTAEQKLEQRGLDEVADLLAIAVSGDRGPG